MGTKAPLRIRNIPLRSRGLLLQLSTLIILPLTVLSLVITVGAITLHQGAMRNLVGERDERAARAAARALDEQLDHRASVIRTLALNAASNSALDNLHEILSNSNFLLNDFDQGIAFASRRGEILAATGNSDFWNSLNSGTDPELKNIFARDVPQTFLSYRPARKGETIIFVASAAGKGAPIALGAFSPGAMAHPVLADVFSPTSGSVAFLIDGDLEILYQVGSLEETRSLREHPGVAEALGGESGASYVQIGRSEHVVAYSPVPQAGWALVIDEPWESVASPLLRTTEIAPLVLVPALLVALLALWFSSRQIVKPLQDLEARAASLAWGDFKAIQESVGGIDEIQRLQRELTHLAGKVQAAQASLKGYIGAITTAQEEERRRVARELHDETIQSLIALNQRVQLVLLAPGSTAVADPLTEIQQLTEQTIEDLRRLTRALRPLYLEDLGLVAALDMLVRETSVAASMPIQFKSKGTEKRLAPHLELALYRIAQEGLSNMARHSQAEHGSLRLLFNRETITLQIMDDGEGFTVPESPAELAPGGHFGLLGLYERADLIGARISLQSMPGEGTTLELTLTNPQPENGSPYDELT